MMKQSLYRGPIIVKKSPIHGYGVFATQAIKKGSLVEECHTLFTEKKDQLFINYYFSAKNQSAIPLGYGCIYNHSFTPNVSYEYNDKTELLIFTALRNISAGEEIFSSYGNDWFSSRNIQAKKSPWWRYRYALWRGLMTCLALWGIIQSLKYFT